MKSKIDATVVTQCYKPKGWNLRFAINKKYDRCISEVLIISNIRSSKSSSSFRYILSPNSLSTNCLEIEKNIESYKLPFLENFRCSKNVASLPPCYKKKRKKWLAIKRQKIENYIRFTQSSSSNGSTKTHRNERLSDGEGAAATAVVVTTMTTTATTEDEEEEEEEEEEEASSWGVLD